MKRFIQGALISLTLCIICVAVCLATSANQNIDDNGGEFESDTTQRVCQMASPGGVISNSGTVTMYVNFYGGACPSGQPAGPGCATIPAAASIPIPTKCSRFTFQSGASTYFLVTK